MREIHAVKRFIGFHSIVQHINPKNAITPKIKEKLPSNLINKGCNTTANLAYTDNNLHP